MSFAPGTIDDYRSGALDYIRIEDATDVLLRFQQGGLRLHYLETFFLGFLCDQPPFTSRDLRLAFARSINRQALVQQVWTGGGDEEAH